MMSGGIETVADAGAGSKFLDAALPTSAPAGEGGAPSPFDEDERDGAVGDAARRGVVGGILAQSAHRTTASVHVAFKLAAIASYLLLGIFTSSFVVQFVVTVTLLAVDFWTVKNVSGRLLVGLRWWNEIGEDGTTQTWRFESLADRSQVNSVDSRIFWWTLYLNPLAWVLLGVVCLLKFNVSYLVIVVIALVLAAANIVGYYKCDKDATEQMRSYIGKTVLGQAMEHSGLGGLSRFMP